MVQTKLNIFKINATRIITITYSIIAGLIGIGYGVFEILQGNVSTNGFVIDPIGSVHRITNVPVYNTITILPNTLLAGILVILINILLIIWVITSIHKKYGAIVLILLSITQFVVGGGIMQTFLLIIIGILAAKINSPLIYWKKNLSVKLRKFLSMHWIWLLTLSALLYFLHDISAIFIITTGSFLGLKFLNLGLIFGYLAIMPFILTVASGLAHDSLKNS